jgi:phosphatidylglycerol:prolipoprotein diacylglycerol transferase
MAPVLKVFGLPIRSYPLAAVLAVLTAAALAWPALGKRAWSPLSRVLTIFAMVVAFLIGARLWNLAVSPGAYGPDRPWYTLQLTGLSLYGGILGAFFPLLAAARLKRQSLWAALDAFTMPAAAGFCLIRVGCFLNGCCRGIPTRLPWGVVFPAMVGGVDLNILGAAVFRQAVHPTQLYELLGAVACIVLALRVVRRFSLPEGGRFLVYATCFSAMRLCILPLRALRYPDWIRWGFYPALYLALIATGILLLRRILRRLPTGAPRENVQ